MTRGLKIYFWEPSLSPHKQALISALMESDAVESVICIAQKPLQAERVRLGWTSSRRTEEQRVVMAPDKDQVRSIVQDSPVDAIHIFSGLHWVPCIVWGLREVRVQRRRHGIMSEPRNKDGWKGLLRLIHSSLTESTVRKSSDFVLAIGRHGPDWFAKVGYDSKKIFPFAYFVPDPCPSWGPRARSEEPVIGFVGRMNKDKGFDLFIESLLLLRKKVKVVVAGAGPSSHLLSRLQGRSHINFESRGIVPMESIGRVMSDLDILVVPSLTKNDGWAVVISEALMSGTSVISSSHVGGSICLNEPMNGRILLRLKPKELAEQISELIDSDLLSEDSRYLRRGASLQKLSAQMGADYLISILSHCYENAPMPKKFY